MGSNNSFASKLRRGKIGEGHIAAWLRRNGYHVLPVYETEMDTGKGPALYQAIGDPLIAPDMLVFKNHERVSWIEAKTKSAFTWHRITKRWVTGIDLHHYEDYIKVAEVSPWPVYLLFLQMEGQAKDSPEGCPTGLYGGELSQLQNHENHRHNNWGKGGMIYWASDVLTKFAELDEVILKGESRG